MGKWLERARKARAVEDIRDDSANSRASTPNVPIVPNVPALLPAVVIMGLRRLEVMPVPSVAAPAVWHQIVADALMLAGEGWALSALSLGWSEADLLGSSPDREGAAVWLAGRRPVLIDAETLVVVNQPRGRAQFTRCRQGMPGAKLLWELQ